MLSLKLFACEATQRSARLELATVNQFASSQDSTTQRIDVRSSREVACAENDASGITSTTPLNEYIRAQPAEFQRQFDRVPAETIANACVVVDEANLRPELVHAIESFRERYVYPGVLTCLQAAGTDLRSSDSIDEFAILFEEREGLENGVVVQMGGQISRFAVCVSSALWVPRHLPWNGSTLLVGLRPRHSRWFEDDSVDASDRAPLFERSVGGWIRRTSRQ